MQTEFLLVIYFQFPTQIQTSLYKHPSLSSTDEHTNTQTAFDHICFQVDGDNPYLTVFINKNKRKNVKNVESCGILL